MALTMAMMKRFVMSCANKSMCKYFQEEYFEMYTDSSQIHTIAGMNNAVVSILICGTPGRLCYQARIKLF
jgi:hypothetical protein